MKFSYNWISDLVEGLDLTPRDRRCPHASFETVFAPTGPDCPSRRGKTAAIGLVPNNARVPPQAGMAEGELPKARPILPWAPTGSMGHAAAPK